MEMTTCWMMGFHYLETLGGGGTHLALRLR